MTRACRLATILIAGCVTAVPAAARQTPTTPPAETAPAPNDYGRDESWLCRPGRQDACAIDLTTMVVAPDGTATRETWAANPNAPIDCFYVYPTVSRDPLTFSDMTIGDEERNVVRQQFARFGSQCRPFAPMCARSPCRGCGHVSQARASS